MDDPEDGAGSTALRHAAGQVDLGELHADVIKSYNGTVHQAEVERPVDPAGEWAQQGGVVVQEAPVAIAAG